MQTRRVPLPCLTLVAALVAIPSACSSSDEGANDPADAGTPDVAQDAPADVPIADSASEDNEVQDAPTTQDGDTQDAPPEATADVQDASLCTGDCRDLSVQAAFEGAPVPFERAFYGLTTPEDGGTWTAHVELYVGGSSSCPTESSPTPDVTLIVAGLGLDDGAAPPSVTVLDFTGNLLGGEMLSTAQSVVVENIVHQVCMSCVGDPENDPDGFVAFDLAASFEQGEVDGHVFATHCASLDI